jgi:hypothetical protein
VPSLFEGRFGENAGRCTTVGMQMLLVENLFLIVVGRNLNWYRDNSLAEIDRDCSIEELTIRERA